MSMYKVFHKQEIEPGSLLYFWKCSLHSKVTRQSANAAFRMKEYFSVIKTSEFKEV